MRQVFAIAMMLAVGCSDISAPTVDHYSGVIPSTGFIEIPLTGTIDRMPMIDVYVGPGARGVVFPLGMAPGNGYGYYSVTERDGSLALRVDSAPGNRYAVTVIR